MACPPGALLPRQSTASRKPPPRSASASSSPHQTGGAGGSSQAHRPPAAGAVAAALAAAKGHLSADPHAGSVDAYVRNLDGRQLRAELTKALNERNHYLAARFFFLLDFD